MGVTKVTQLGLHIVHRKALAKLAERGLAVESRVGVVELLRSLEGLAEPPDAGVPLGVDGLDELLRAAGDDAADVLRLLRTRLREARRYFDKHGIALVFVVEGALDASVSDGVTLEVAGRPRGVEALTGSPLAPVAGADGWWHAAQVS